MDETQPNQIVSKEAISKILENLFVVDNVDLNDPKIDGKESTIYKKNSGFFVQCQYLPNAMQHPTLRSEVILHPSDIYEKEIEYKFGICGMQ